MQILQSKEGIAMYHPNNPGRPPGLTEEMIPAIISATYKVIIPNQVAGLCNIPRSTFKEWLQKGKEHINLGQDSIYAQLSAKFTKAQSEVCSEIISNLKFCPKNYGALTWILEKCFKEDFMSLPEDVQKMLDFFINELPKLKGKGEFPHVGKETQSRSEKTETEEI